MTGYSRRISPILQQQTGDTLARSNSLERVVRLLPQSPDAWHGLGLALGAAKRDDEAISAFQQATRLLPGIGGEHEQPGRIVCARRPP